MTFQLNQVTRVPPHDHSTTQKGGKITSDALADDSQIARLDVEDVQTFSGDLVIPGAVFNGPVVLPNLNTTPLLFVINGFICSLGAASVTDARDWVFPDASGTLSAGGSASISSAAVAFTDGDTYRRVTITDAAVSAASKIVGTVIRPDSTNDTNDTGIQYVANVVRRATGEFDLAVQALDFGGEPPETVNETVTFAYMVG